MAGRHDDSGAGYPRTLRLPLIAWRDTPTVNGSRSGTSLRFS